MSYTIDLSFMVGSWIAWVRIPSRSDIKIDSIYIKYYHWKYYFKIDNTGHITKIYICPAVRPSPINRELS